MGWLLDAAKELEIFSLRKLAYQMRESPSWPKRPSLKNPESLANKLRDLDKGKDSAWWQRKGKAFLRPLAEALQMTPEELLQEIQRADGTSSVSAWNFDTFSALRPLDLRSEPLLPGIPPEFIQDGGPRAERTWWLAPPGAGKTLVGRWLEVRFGWTRLETPSWKEMLRALPERGRVFVELVSPEGLGSLGQIELPPSLKLCVAAPFDLPREPERTLTGDGELFAPPFDAPVSSADEVVEGGQWELVRVPPAQTWGYRLIQWAAQRVRPGGGFDEGGVRRLFNDKTLVSVFSTPGELIGFLGLIDDVGLDAIAADDSDHLRWVRAWLKAAAERGDRVVTPAVKKLLRKKGDSLLVGIVLERMRRWLDTALPPEEWALLVPEELVPPLDRDALLKHIEDGSASALAKAQSMLKPERSDVVKGLEAVRALVAHGDGRLLLHPTWLRHLLDDEAFRQLFDAGPEGIGTLLLHAETAESALFTLLETLQGKNWGSIESLLANVDSAQPERLVLIDGVFRAIGLALARGYDVPLALLQRAWDVQMRHTTQRWKYFPDLPLISIGTGTSRASLEVWFFAALMISYKLAEEGESLPASALAPWNSLPADQIEQQRFENATSYAVDAFRRSDGSDHSEELRLAAFRLGGHLLDRVGVMTGHAPFDAQTPDLIVELSLGCDHNFEFSEGQRTTLLKLECGYAALADACRRRGAKLDEVLQWCWGLWASSSQLYALPPFTWGREGREVTEHVWRVVPTECLSEKMLKTIEKAPQIFPWLPPEVWERWLTFWSAQEHPPVDARIWNVIPKNLALVALREGHVGPFHHKIREVLWSRIPDELLAVIDELTRIKAGDLPGGERQLIDLVFSTPVEHMPLLLQRAADWVEHRDEYPGVGGWLTNCLLRAVAERVDGWRDAYALLLRVVLQDNVQVRPN